MERRTLPSYVNEEQFERWRISEIAANEKFREIPVTFEEKLVLNCTVLRGFNIKRTSVLNIVDLPNPQIEIECPLAIGSTKLRTTSIIDTVNPVWNENLTFVLKAGYKTEEDREKYLKFVLIVEDWHAAGDRIAEKVFNICKLKPGDKIEEEISFDKRGCITVVIELCKRRKPDLQLSLGLSKSEMNFRDKRIPKVMGAVRKFLNSTDAPRSLHETPIMTLVGSGGGVRATICMSSFIESLNDMGLLDCITYALGTSGSSWYLCGAYTRKALTGTKHDEYRDWLRKSFRKQFFWEFVKMSNLPKFRKIQKEKNAAGQPVSLADYYGLCVCNKTIGKEYANAKLSDMRTYVETGDVPYPLFALQQVHEVISIRKYHACCHLSPFEFQVPQYGVSVDMELLNSEFQDTILTKKISEPDLSYVVGALGSIFGVRLNRLLGIHEFEDTDILENPDQFRHCADDGKGPVQHVLEWLNNFSPFLDRNVFIQRTAKLLNFVRGYSGLQRFAINPFADPHADNPDPVEGLSPNDETITVVDEGLLTNLGIDAALRPQRRNDILFVADVTDYDADHRGKIEYGNLVTTIKLAKEGGYKFPDVDVEKMKREKPKELQIFEDEKDPECPIVFWFLLGTSKFRQLKDFKPRNAEVLKDLKSGECFNDFKVYHNDAYTTFKTSYTDLEFERLRELIYFNVTSNSEIIKKKIRERILWKRTQLETSR